MGVVCLRQPSKGAQSQRAKAPGSHLSPLGGGEGQETRKGSHCMRGPRGLARLAQCAAAVGVQPPARGQDWGMQVKRKQLTPDLGWGVAERVTGDKSSVSPAKKATQEKGPTSERGTREGIASGNRIPMGQGGHSSKEVPNPLKKQKTSTPRAWEGEGDKSVEGSDAGAGDLGAARGGGRERGRRHKGSPRHLEVMEEAAEEMEEGNAGVGEQGGETRGQGKKDGGGVVGLGRTVSGSPSRASGQQEGAGEREEEREGEGDGEGGGKGDGNGEYVEDDSAEGEGKKSRNWTDEVSSKKSRNWIPMAPLTSLWCHGGSRGCLHSHGKSSSEARKIRGSESKKTPMRQCCTWDCMGASARGASSWCTPVWCLQEDIQLTRCVRAYGERNWTEIALRMPGRTGKSCRLRYSCILTIILIIIT